MFKIWKLKNQILKIWKVEVDVENLETEEPACGDKDNSMSKPSSNQRRQDPE